MNRELPYVQAGFRRGRGTRDHIASFHWITEKAREFQKNVCFIDYAKALTVWITINWKILKEMGIAGFLICFLQTCMQVKKQQLELDMEQTGSKLGKEYIKSVYCHLAYLTYMQSISCKMPGWMKYRLELRLQGETSITSDMQMTPPLWQSEEELRSLLMKVKEKGEKANLKLKIQKTKIMASSPITSWQIDGKQWKQ